MKSEKNNNYTYGGAYLKVPNIDNPTILVNNHWIQICHTTLPLNSAIVKFPAFIRNKIPAAPWYSVYISQLIHFVVLVSSVVHLMPERRWWRSRWSNTNTLIIGWSNPNIYSSRKGNRSEILFFQLIIALFCCFSFFHDFY